MEQNAPAQRPVALVVGASRGLGLIIAHELAARGHDVAVCARDEESLARAADELRLRHGVRVHHQVCDVRDATQVQRLVTGTEEALGPIDVSISVAGIIQVGPLEAVQEHHFRDAIDIMLWGQIHVALAVIPGMRERNRGRIGIVTSIGGRISPPRMVPYSTAKHGAIGFAEGIAAELGGTGVTVTTLVPGLMRTGSPKQASFFGDAGKQYAWFGPAASLPLLSIDAERAARIMVDGVLRGKPVTTVSPLAHVASRVHGLAPGTTVRMMRLVSRLLPKGANSQTVSGEQARADLKDPRLVDLLTTLGDRAGKRFNQE